MSFDFQYQQTLEQETSYTGIGLHTGQEVTINFKPSAADSGIKFKRVDLPGQPEIKATVDNVLTTNRCTTIGNQNFKISTIEHLLAALGALGIDNLLIELDAEEVPVTDGSAQIYLDLLTKTGVKRLAKARLSKKVKETVSLRERNSFLIALPFEGLRITYTFVSEHPAVGNQFADLILTEETFRKEVAASRTFGFAREVEALQKRGLALGGSLENAVLIGEEEIVNELRFDNEFARHKILDIIGDLTLIEPFTGHIVAVRSGHALNIDLAKKLREQFKSK
ncbi:UDP-3-O-acyl-N-acetylglucosamine deacetylase [Fuchsiella alkaliacetigena]|uniref:UDP-3-O-acyl-N-acetylglucosamine deacetylase n=1 Tax=Fuchsiella alkaliacetigena TaxID=957042 RepID=UPI00200B4121|nr:UDP-3-O-acyl-N-acetylglucosamine deacetylase [Fuchsiella alkaliacetigena]MCK8824268.1 UDP-3-O-acyl-N-acetylglucosamine deacetylase [Fuchsiella alkaliacetigena]